jgi:predicted MPP superfamily phosphohydrolase
MTRIFLILIITLSFQSLTKADVISDFQIERMSIGDSLSDYFTKKEIRVKRKERIKYPNSNKFTAITFDEHSKLKVYDSVQINVKTKDKKYIIYSISGINYFDNNISKCKEQMKLISNELIKIFPNASNINQTKKHEYDKSGESLIHQSIFDMDSGAEARVECYDWSKKMFKKHNLEDQLIVSILSDDFSYFMANEAYK